MTTTENLPLALFAFPGALRDRLVAAVLSGAKTATTSLRVDYEREGEPLPTAGSHQLVVDSEGRGVGVIEILSVAVMRLAEADESLARDEGEGFRDVAEWRAAHEHFWSGYIDEIRRAIGDPAFRIDDDTQIVVERFRLVPR